MIDKCC